MKIVYTCFEVSGLCNMDCKFCFSKWRNNRKQIDIAKAKHILDVLKSNGLEAINLTGGEPLLRDDIEDLCKYAKQIGLMTIISTNGILLLEKEKVLNYIDAINLPLDSFNPKIHNEMRPCAVKNHHQLVLDLIDYIKTNYPNIKIKINTLVSKPNIKDVANIGKLIENKVYSWKLSKFLSSGYGNNYEQEFTITDAEFNDVAHQCQHLYRVCNVVEDYKVEGDEIFDIFIDGLGHVNIHKKDVIEDIGDIDKLSNYILSDIDLNKEYLNSVYKYKEEENE